MPDVRPIIKCEIAWATGGINPTTSLYQDESQRLIGLSISRGRDDELADIQPGRANLTFSNVDTRYTPNSSGTLNLLPGRTVRLTAAPGDGAEYGVAEYGVDSYGSSNDFVPLWYGLIEEIRPHRRLDEPICEIVALDGLAWLSGRKSTRVDSATGAGNMVANALNDAAWPGGSSLQADFRNIENAGVITNKSASWTSEEILTQIRTITESENLGSMYYVAKDGKFTWQDSSHRTEETSNNW